MGDVVHSNQCLLNLNVSPSTVSTLIVSVAENKQSCNRVCISQCTSIYTCIYVLILTDKMSESKKQSDS